MATTDPTVDDFGRLFQRFLHQVVYRAEGEESPFLPRLRDHLGADPLGLAVVAETFPPYQHVNAQVALDAYLAEPGRSAELVGVVGQQKRFQGLSLSDLIGSTFGGMIPQPGPVDYANLPTGVGRTLACVQFGLYLVAGPDGPLVALVRGAVEHGPSQDLTVEVMAPEPAAATAFLARLRELMAEHDVYRGQVISIGPVNPYHGHGAFGVTFHELRGIGRDQVVLPASVLERLERHVVGLADQRQRLLAAGRHLKRGLLLHGPPGTGKTLSVRYLTTRLAESTVLLLSGRGFGTIGPSCAMARALQPAVVVLEDVDLVAEERTMPGVGTNPLLFELLNEMDGMADDADVVFLLTTNRPDLLEPALAARPGRIDQAVEIDLPDADGRRRLLALYGEGLDVRLDDPDAVVARTEGVTASFVKELLRKAALGAALEDAGSLVVRDRHLHAALDELLVEGGALTKLLLGAADHPPPTTRASMGWMPGAGGGGGVVGGWSVTAGDG